MYIQGLAFGVADGVGGNAHSTTSQLSYTNCLHNIGWGDILDPGLFSQALMYYASEAAAQNWPSEPESDPTSEVPIQVPGKELSPTECLDIAFKGVLRDRHVEGGMYRRPSVHELID